MVSLLDGNDKQDGLMCIYKNCTSKKFYVDSSCRSVSGGLVCVLVCFSEECYSNL